MTSRGVAGSAAIFQDCQVLVVSENKFTWQLLKSLLPAIGVRFVATSHSNADAESRIKVGLFDALIIDVGPAAHIDAPALIACVRSMPDSREAQTPVVMLVSNASEDLIYTARKSGVSHIIAKPFTPAALYAHVESALLQSIHARGRHRGECPRVNPEACSAWEV